MCVFGVFCLFELLIQLCQYNRTSIRLFTVYDGISKFVVVVPETSSIEEKVHRIRLKNYSPE